MQIYSVTVFSYIFLAIFTISHAFVFWIPVWKTTTVIRHYPGKGWAPVKSRGSSFIKPRKPSYSNSFPIPSFSSHRHHFRPGPPKHLRHFPSYFRPSVRVQTGYHKYKAWKPTRPLWDLNRHHPLCPLCHLPAFKKPRKPVVYRHSEQYSRPHSPQNIQHFTPSDAFPKYSHVANHHFRELSHFPKNNYFRQFNDFHGPRLPSFAHFPKIMYQFPKHSAPIPFHAPLRFRRHGQRPGNSLYQPIYNSPRHSQVYAPTQGSVTHFPKDFSNFGFTGFGSGSKGHGWSGWDW